jgi:hypothetical protein
VVTVFDGRTHQVAFSRGERDGLPVFGWGESPSTLLTRAQLKAARGEDARYGLRPGGQDPVALLVFRHHKPFRREECAELFSVELAKPCRAVTPAMRRGIGAALRARRICSVCREDVGYCVPTSTRICWDCDGVDCMEVAA